MKIKYAIYQSEVGKFAIDYHDTLESLKGYLCEPYVKKEDLPVLINNIGGKTSFKDWNINKFVEIKEVDENEELLTREEMFPKNPDYFNYGWIDREGNAYLTGIEGHYDAVRMICKELNINKSYDYERVLEELNWIKTTKSNHFEELDCYCKRFKITQAQIETLKKYELDKYNCVKSLIKYNSGEI